MFVAPVVSNRPLSFCAELMTMDGKLPKWSLKRSPSLLWLVYSPSLKMEGLANAPFEEVSMSLTPPYSPVMQGMLTTTNLMQQSSGGAIHTVERKIRHFLLVLCFLPQPLSSHPSLSVGKAADFGYHVIDRGDDSTPRFHIRWRLPLLSCLDRRTMIKAE